MRRRAHRSFDHLLTRGRSNLTLALFDLAALFGLHEVSFRCIFQKL